MVLSLAAGCNNQWSSGDRVLVSKLQYDNGVTRPNRYDVVVFKYPGKGPDEGPMDKNTPKNYIKRLLGLPGELLAIFFGRIYRWSPGEDDPLPFDDLKEPNVDPNELFRPFFTHTNDPTSRQWFEDGIDPKTGKERKFEIVRKPPSVMLALRRLVYDNDYQAKDLKGKYDRWNPEKGSGWKADQETTFLHEGKAGDQVDWLHYQHLLRPDGPVVGGENIKPRLITDVMDYNSFQVPNGFDRERFDRSPAHPNWVGDLMIECNVEVIEPRGEFYLELSKGINRFQARWDLSTGQCTISRIGIDNKPAESSTQATSVKGPGSHMLRFSNIDARLTVWVDRSLPFGNGMEYDPPEVRSPKDKGLSAKDIEERRGPRGDNDLQPASVGSKGAHVKISHVRLWRDTYYTTSASFNDPDYQGMNQPDEWADKDRWEPLKKQRFVTMFVQPGHYLCLGDNSQASSDSRDWGLVPQRLMLGRALMVYYPLDRIGPIR